MDFLTKLFKTPTKNGNLCERGQGSPIEAVTTKSFDEDPVSTPPKPEFAVTEEKSQNSAEEDQSQALTDTNSASFVSLNTISASEAVFNSATGDHSRPISADTDSLDYESADESVKTEDQKENGVKLNESLGLDALTNKLSNLYLNSPHVSKKSPAFHSEDTSSAASTTVLSDESISDISFSASLIEVIQHTSQTENQPEYSHSTVELVVEEISEPEELAEPEKKQDIVEPEKKEEHIVSPVDEKQQVECPIKPEEPAAKQEGQTEFLELDSKVPSAKLVSEVEPQAELESGAEPQAEEPGKTELETEPELENKADSQAEKQSQVELPTEESAVTSDELNVLVATEDISWAVVPEVIVPCSDTDQASENLLKANELSAIETETAEIKEEKPQDIKAVEEQLVSETQQETPVAVCEAPQEKVVDEAPATLESLDELKQQQTEVASAPEKELEESCTQESGAVEEESAKEETKEELVQLVDPEVAPTAFEHKEIELVEETKEPESLEVPKESDLFEEPDTCKSIEAQKEQEQSLNAEKVQAEQLEVVVDPEVSTKPERAVEFSGEVSFVEPNLISLDSTESVPSEALIQDFELAKEQINCQLDRQDQVVKLELFKELDQPEKEVSEEKPVVERKIAPATVFIQEKKEVETLKKEPIITSTGSLSELLDLCKQQQRNLEDEVDTRVVEETNELQERIAADADLVCQELNASLSNINAEMSDNEVPITPPRRSRSPRKPSPGRNVDFEEDPFKSKARVGISPSRETMNLSAESVLVSSRMSMSKSTDSASMKLMRSMDSGIAGAEMNHSEAGPDIASQDEQFVPATEELFKDPSAFDFLSKFGGNDSSASRLERESLYVKFDPLVGNRDRKVFLSPCIEASPRSEEISDTPAASKMTAKSDTPLTSRHAVGPLVQIATPVQEPLQLVVQPTAASKENQQREAEKEALQQMIVLHKKESEELKKLMTSQIEDYEQTIGSLQAKLKQKTEAEEQMSLVMKEYEDTISRILAEKEKAMEKSQEEKQKLTDELAIIQSDLSAAEIAFSDLHRKYERSKSAIEVFKSNENTLKQSNLQFQEQIKQAEKKYMILKTHAEDKLEQAAKENEALVKSSELEISALKAQNAQLKARNNTLVETLGMRERENQELVTICDDLVKKLGPH